MLLVGTVLAAIGLAVAIGRLGLAGQPRIAGKEPWILASAVLGLTLVEVVYYNLTYIQAQGRYLFPALTWAGRVDGGGLAGVAICQVEAGRLRIGFDRANCAECRRHL